MSLSRYSDHTGQCQPSPFRPWASGSTRASRTALLLGSRSEPPLRPPFAEPERRDLRQHTDTHNPDLIDGFRDLNGATTSLLAVTYSTWLTMDSIPSEYIRIGRAAPKPSSAPPLGVFIQRNSDLTRQQTVVANFAIPSNTITWRASTLGCAFVAHQAAAKQRQAPMQVWKIRKHSWARVDTGGPLSRNHIASTLLSGHRKDYGASHYKSCKGNPLHAMVSGQSFVATESVHQEKPLKV